MTDEPTTRAVPYWTISSDSHVLEPPDLYTTRIARKYRDVAPRTTVIDGLERWLIDDVPAVEVAASYRPGDRFVKREERPPRTSFGHGVESTVISKWIEDNEKDGVWGGIVFPSPSMLCYAIPDSELVTEIFRTYNEWILDSVEGFRDRVKPVAMVNVDDIGAAAKYVATLREQGFAGGAIPVCPAEGHPYSSDEYEPLWAAAEETETVLHLHVATNRRPWRLGNTRSTTVSEDVNIYDHYIRMALSDIVLCGVFERHPRLRVVSVEHEAAWWAHWLYRMDWHYRYNARKIDEFYRFADGAVPSDFAKRNLYVSFIEDPLAVEHRRAIGIDHLMWGSDYPHPEATFPRSDVFLTEWFRDVPDADAERILWRNTMQLYGFDQPPAMATSRGGA